MITKRTVLQITLPVVVLLTGGAVVYLMVALRPATGTEPQARPVPVVRAMTARAESVQVTVRTQGTVEPRTEIDVVPEVAGKVVRVSESLTDGGFFDNGEVLLAIDPRDYELAITRAEASVAQADQRLKIEEAEAEVARKEWQALGRGGNPNPLVLREPQLAEARAALAAAHAELEEARLDLQRTRIEAPFAGRVREETVDVGQFVTVGQRLARIYSVDCAEVRLPLPDQDLAYLDLPLDFRSEGTSGPRVELSADFAGRRHHWWGSIARVGGEIDARTRQITLIAQVADPYARGADDRPPLAVGMFVQAEIFGRRYQDVIVLPRSAVRDDRSVLLIDDDSRIEFREVELLRRERDRVLVRGGIRSGETVCLSTLESLTPGTVVQVQSEVADPAQAPERRR